MRIKIGSYEFERADYDAENDILYLGIRERLPGIGEETPEGHTITFAEDGKRVIGVDLFGPRELLGREGAIRITLPDGSCETVRGIEAVLGLSQAA